MTELAEVSDEGPNVFEALDAALDEIAGLRKALESRAVIEQAKGMIMLALHVDADAAFQVLVKRSQATHRKAVEIAHDIVEAGRRGRPVGIE